MTKLLILLLGLLTISSCSSNNTSEKMEQNPTKQQKDSAIIEETTIVTESISDTSFIVLNDYNKNFAYDMKYATADNFIKQKVYTCTDCIIRKEVADALIKVNDSIMLKGYKIKFFDCYRPLDVQKKMWKVYPNAQYVANPYKNGSIHNRGGAVDVTLVDNQGNELDMGTKFDHFGKQAHHDYKALSDTILGNRKLLKTAMETYGFKSIRTEWWHYNFHEAKKYPISNFQTKCD